MVTAQDVQPAPSEAQPIPPRYWWAKRIAILVAVVIAGLAALRWWWGYEVGRRFQAEINRYRAAGQLVFPEDFAQPPIADAENAALVLEQASEALSHLTPEQRELYEDRHDPEQLIAERPGDVADLLKATVEARTLVRKTRSLSRADWGLPIQSWLVGPGFVSHSPRRKLARLLGIAATYSHHIGDDAETIETLRDTLAMAAHVDRRPTIISHSAALGMRPSVAYLIERISWRLELCNSVQSSARLAARAQVQRLVGDLLDEGSVERRLGHRWACYGDRTQHIDSFARIAGGGTALLGKPRPLVRIGAFLFKPFNQLERVRGMQAATECADVGEGVAWPDWAARREPSVASPFSKPIVWPFGGLLIPVGWSCYCRFVEIHLCGTALNRTAAVALAIRLYELDHGRRPARLSELVPDYLPAVPKDPFGAKGHPIGYAPDAKPPVLYSVGFDGVDEKGAFALRPDGYVDRSVKDFVFFLNGDRPRGDASSGTSRPASSQRTEDQDDVRDRQDHAAGDQNGKGSPDNRQE